MAIRISPPQNKTYYINPAHLTFNENSGYGANLIQVSASSSCYISVYDPANGIGYSDADRNYRRWKVTAYNNKFPDDKPEQKGEWYIYVRLERDGLSALVVYDQVLRGVKGGEVTVSKDESGNDVYTEAEPEQDTYWFIRIGDVGATDGTSIRSIVYDTGYLTSDEGRDTAELNEMWELDKYSTPWLIRAKQWLAGFSVKGLIKLMGGLIFSSSDGTNEKLISDVKRSFDSDEDVPVDDFSVPTTAWVDGHMDDRFLRKDEEDETNYKIKFFDGIECGQYVTGMLGGSGTRFDGEGYGEMNGLTLREFLEVPELRFNRVDVISGELWNSVAFGLVAAVDIESQTCTLKLEENERAGLLEGDICRGIFADFGDGDLWEGTDDYNFLHLYGFKTVYFSVTEILVNEKGAFSFVYSLPQGSTEHPSVSMKFAVYGTFDYIRHPERMASAYSTRTYKRYLNGVNQYKIEPDKHIYAQFGLLDGLVISGQEMSGYGSYQHNSYFSGVQIQFTDEQKESLKGEDAYSAVLSDYVGVVRMDGNGNLHGGVMTEENVVTGDENVVTGDENVVTTDYLLKTRIQAFRGPVELAYSEESAAVGMFIASLSPSGCSAEIVNGVIYITGVFDYDHCHVSVSVSCEGKAVISLVYQVKVVKDGDSVTVYSLSTSASVVKHEDDGTFSPSHVSSKVLEKTGNSIRELDSIPDGFRLELWVGGQKLEEYGYGDEYEVESDESLQFRLYQEEQLADVEDLPVIVSGRDGESPLVADLSNELIAVACDYEGTPVESEVYVTCYTLYYGLEKVTLDSLVAETVESGIVLETDAKTGTVSVSGVGSVTSEEFVITVTGTAVVNGKEESRSKELKIIKVIPGKEGVPGDNAVVYSVSPLFVSIGKTSTGNPEPGSVTFTCYKTVGSVKSEVNVWWDVYTSEDNEDWEQWKAGQTGKSITLSMTTFTKTYKYIWVVAKVLKDGTFEEVAEARAQLILDGEPGTNVAAGAMPYNCGEYYRYTRYYYNADRRDIVTYNGGVYMVKNFNESGYIQDVLPTDSSYWIRGSEDTFRAMDTALIDKANIGGFMFSAKKAVNGIPVGILESQYGPMSIVSVSDTSSWSSSTSNGGVFGKTSFVISASGVFDGVTYTNTNTLTLVKVETDVSSLYYHFSPSAHYLVNKEPTSLSCRLKVPGASEDLPSLPSGFSMKYSIDGTSYSYTYGNEVGTSYVTSTFIWHLYYGSIEVGRFTINAGKNGMLVLGNEIIPFSCDSSGKVTSPLPVSLNPDMYISRTMGCQITLLNYTSPDGVEISMNRIKLDAETGTLYANNVDLTGNINAVTGFIGGFSLANGTIMGGDKYTMVLDPNENGFPSIRWMYDGDSLARLSLHTPEGGYVSGQLILTDIMGYNTVIAPDYARMNGYGCRAELKASSSGECSLTMTRTGISGRPDAHFDIDNSGYIRFGGRWYDDSKKVNVGELWVDDDGYIKLRKS